MAVGSLPRVVRASGKIIIGPTDLSTADPYGGTEVGRAKLCVVVSLGEMYRVEGEGLGETTDILEAEKRFAFSCFLRGWDDDAVDLLLNDGDTNGSVSQHKVWSAPGTTVAGASAIGRAVILLYVPDNIVEVNSVLIYRGIPQMNPGVAMALQRGEEFGIPLALQCMRDGNGNTISIGRFSDLTLT